MSKNNRVVSMGKIGLAITIFSIIGLLAAACGSSSVASGGPSGRVRPVLLTAAVQGDSMSIPLSKVQGAWNTRFMATFPAGAESFMVYIYKGQTYVRASVCVPCGGRSFSLQGSTLICDSCDTVYDAATGKGMSGVPACQTYSKVPVPFQVDGNGNVVMKNADLLAAYQKTLNRTAY
ncbi:MAG: Fe-S-containing protein [Dehalococcoidia bacterium]|nr:Fe-S-containing protein [Dehalococcoidia bacterium]